MVVVTAKASATTVESIGTEAHWLPDNIVTIEACDFRSPAH